jgi:membrane-bound lytic murein transglycosylase D
MADLCRWNNLAPDSVLQPGDRIYVGEAPPASRSDNASAFTEKERARAVRHRVKRGETLHRIALLYDVTIGDVRLWNNLGATNRIYAGQVLTIRAD